MTDYEKLGSFYLGKLFNHELGQVSDDLLLYDSKDLTTHAVCVGMTGSGKTGLCVSLLEEAAIDGIPAIVIDPKGDLGNLLLTFPELKPTDFEPWLEAAEAARKGMTLPQLAEKTADTWRKGLESWHQPVDRIARLRQSADFAIYTPGSTAGRPISVLRSFNAPPQETIDDASAFRDHVVSSVSGLLALVGISGDPLRSRDHILLSSILDATWRQGQSLDIAGLINAIQKPPFSKVGVFDLESFYPAKERLELAMSLNNLIASPGFSVWTEGEPLDVQRLLYTADGKPRVSILSIAHLADSERMFFVTLLLNAVIAWMRTQSGTSSLRALLYMDEIFGYFPPTANPPSKPPMLTLLKQARAFGLGVVLATQNPVDLDYKGLANTGTWLIGRLQTDRDKARVLDGLESAAQGSGQGFARGEMDQLLSGLGNRVFLLHNVHEEHPVLFQTRWALSFLRGPMTLGQIKTLIAPTASRPPAPTPTPAFAPAQTVQNAAPITVSAPAATARPVVPPGVNEFFLKLESGAGAAYQPTVFAQARLHFVDAKAGVDCWETAQFVHPAVAGAESFDWSKAETTLSKVAAFDRQAPAGVSLAALPDALGSPSNFKLWEKMLDSHIYQVVTMDLVTCPAFKLTSKPGESEGDFKARVQLAVREKRDEEVEKLRQKYAPKFRTLQDQEQRAAIRVEKEKDQYGHQKLSTALSFGTAILGAFLGRRAVSASTMSRTATSLRGASRASKEKRDIAMAEDSLEGVQAKKTAMEQELSAAIEALQAEMTVDRLEFVTASIRPRKSDITLTAFGIGWRPTT